jgi:Na+-translocating ferredoxin:NAD+ oxidoreductase RnfD subunit
LTSTRTKRPLSRAEAARRFFQTPKGLLTVVFAILLAVAGPSAGWRVVAPGLAAAILTGAALDAPILRWRKQAWEFPSGAVLTGLIVAMVLSPFEPWYIAGLTTALAVVSKYVVRTRSANVFNPAALALVLTFYPFHTGQSWWGALPEVGWTGIAALVATGIYIADRVNKMPLVLAFLGAYYLLFTVTAFASDPRWVSEMYREPDVQMVLFFAFFILTDPPTSPARYRGQVICGVIVAVTAFAVFEWVGAAYYLLAGVLVGNVWEAWQRHQVRKRRQTRPAPLAPAPAAT